tara:strand:+ start:137 stop:1573 length:1437 start_codon:yes stop_codon:yes gene_type:complete
MPCDCNKKTEADDNECPEGQSFDVSQGKCVAKESAFGDPKADSTIGDLAGNGSDVGDKQQVEGCPEGHSIDSASGVCQPNGSDKTDSIGQTNASIATEKKLASIEKSLKALTEKKPTAQISNLDDGVYTWKQVAENMAPSLRKFGKFEFDINLESLRSINTKQSKDRMGQVTESFRASPLQLQEAVAISGTHATQDLDTDVALVPGGLSFRPVFEFAKVKRIEAGMDRARFFKTTIPANGSQTVGSTPSQATQTFTSIEVTPSTITGVYLVGDFDEIENSPFDLLQAIVEGSASSYEDFVATDMLDTKSKEGVLTPGLWIRGDTGATITSSNVASMVFDETAIAVGREYLENQGYLRGGIKPVAFLHPQQWRQLITSTNVTSLATRSAPDIWLKAELEQFMGVQLVVSNAVEEKSQTNNAYNAIICVPKHSYGIGIKRDVTVKMHEVGEDNQVRVNTTWRTMTGIIDATSIVRVSTTV